MPTAEHLFTQVWNRLTSDWTRLTTFRQMGLLGEDAAKEAVHKSNTYFVQQQLLNGEYQTLLKDRAKFIEEGMAEILPQSMTDSSVKTFRHTLHAATLVFAHSILDAAIFDCLQICAIMAPQNWSEQLVSKKVLLSETASKGYTELLNNAITDELKRLERESLMTKFDRVFQLCRPKQQEYLTNGFRFDRERLLKLDDTRHKVVHSPETIASFDSIYEDLQFMQSSGVHVFCMIADSFGLQLNPSEACKDLFDRQKTNIALL